MSHNAATGKSNVNEIPDPWSNPNKPIKITIDDVQTAAVLIKSGIVHTPCSPSKADNSHGMDLYLKKEYLQLTGSFKERGARYCILSLSDKQKETGIISASLGNHALALSYHGMKLNVPVTVVMPETAPIMKIQKCRNYKANVIVRGADMAEAKAIAMQIGQDKGLLYINGYDHPHIMAGQGTIGLEILEQVPNPDAVVIPVGGGGLIAGIATAIKTLSPHTKVIGVESENCASFSRAIENKGAILTPVKDTLADGLAVPKVGYNAFVTAAPLIDKMIVVEEKWIALAILRLAEEEKCIVEGAAACSLAAILAGYLNELLGKRVVILLCGANIDTTILGRCLERGLAAEGRLLKFSVAIVDRPGGLQELCVILKTLGVVIKNIKHERPWQDVFKVNIEIICETHGWSHSLELKKNLVARYQDVKFSNNLLSLEKRKSAVK